MSVLGLHPIFIEICLIVRIFEARRCPGLLLFDCLFGPVRNRGRLLGLTPPYCLYRQHAVVTAAWIFQGLGQITDSIEARLKLQGPNAPVQTSHQQLPILGLFRHLLLQCRIYTVINDLSGCYRGCLRRHRFIAILLGARARHWVTQRIDLGSQDIFATL